MDYNQIREDTRRAYADADEVDVDLSYLTDEYIDELVENARDPEQLLIQDPGLEFEFGAQATNYLANAYFIGWTAYGYVASSAGSCNRSWQLRINYRQRSIVRKCSTSPYWYIWSVSS